MAFDKKNAMRNAERYLSQGKTRSAINEYKQVVRNDPRDYVTLNILGDLYVKDDDESSAVKCYNAVAEHYSKQGFAAKAIAVYKKINRIRPNIPEINEKLADLYCQKGSLLDAKNHYVALAEHYQSKGKKIEALDIWKEVAKIDPNNTEVYQTIGETYLKEGKNDDASEAFVMLGERLVKLNRPAAAVDAFQRALDINKFHQDAVSGMVSTLSALGRHDDATKLLEELSEEQPHNRDIGRLQIDLFLTANKAVEAEAALIKLVEVEPSNYDKFLDLARLYIAEHSIDAAARVLNMSSDHLLSAGQIDDYRMLIHELTTLDPEHVESLKLLVGLCTWLRDEPAYIDALKKLAASSRVTGSADDERFALSQLTMVVPHEVEYGERLRELNKEHGFSEDDCGESLFDKQFIDRKPGEAVASLAKDVFQPAAVLDNGMSSHAVNGNGTQYHAADPAPDDLVSQTDIFPISAETDDGLVSADTVMTEDDEDRLVREIDSIKFYVENGYIDLALKAADELFGDFGDRPEIDQLREYIGQHSQPAVADVAAESPSLSTSQSDPNISGSFSLDDLRSELGLEEFGEGDNSSDYETHYGTAIAYQEMGLLEDAIKEFQNAATIVDVNDGTRRFYQCANLLGHCFMEIGKPHLAITWYKRALETGGLSAEEKQGLWYEFANACEANGDAQTAAEYFERVYAENIDFRDVAERLEKLAVAA